MAKESKNKKKFKNPDPQSIISSFEEVSQLENYIVTNNLIGKTQTILKYINGVKSIFIEFCDLGEYVKRCESIKSAFVNLTDSLTYIDGYIQDNLSDFSGAEHLAELINSYLSVFKSNLEMPDVNAIKKSTHVLSDMVLDLIADMFYIGMIATSNEEKINQGLDRLIGRNTEAYIPLLKEDYNNLGK